MTTLDKLYVIGKDITEIHRHTTSMGVSWHRVEPVTEANQLRVRPGQKRLMVTWVPDTAMHPAVKSVVRTQLSIRRCLDLLVELDSFKPVTVSDYRQVANDFYRQIANDLSGLR